MPGRGAGNIQAIPVSMSQHHNAATIQPLALPPLTLGSIVLTTLQSNRAIQPYEEQHESDRTT